MFGVDSTELVVVALIALLVIGPTDLPKAMRVVGQWVGRARGMARHFRSGIDTMMREAELEEMEKKWREDNDRIMRDHPLAQPGDDWALPAPPPPSPPADQSEPPAEGDAPPAQDEAPKLP